jgi:2-polyprenyl-3-methyl-5-hydroxy-6-metoxy-1,4-benzoquinol methylase
VTGERNHYSYTWYADRATARDFDARRFGGPIGDLVARQQAEVLAAFLGPVEGRAILDVGTGTGRAALLLAEAGARVTGVDASEEMLAVARARAVEQHADVTFAPGDAHALAFPDRSFDAAVSLRVLMHTPQWRQCVAELCRVSRQLIVLDYPSARSVALLQSMTRKVVHASGGRTEPYRVFLDGAIDAVIAQHGFRVRSRNRQFALPIALHKTIGSRGFTVRSERLLERLGLLRAFGSPVTLVAERCGHS